MLPFWPSHHEKYLWWRSKTCAPQVHIRVRRVGCPPFLRGREAWIVSSKYILINSIYVYIYIYLYIYLSIYLSSRILDSSHSFQTLDALSTCLKKGLSVIDTERLFPTRQQKGSCLNDGGSTGQVGDARSLCSNCKQLQMPTKVGKLLEWASHGEFQTFRVSARLWETDLGQNCVIDQDKASCIS